MSMTRLKSGGKLRLPENVLPLRSTTINPLPIGKRFRQWVVSSKLEVTHPAEQSAAMWAAANADQFEEARAAGNARTVRGIHLKWKEIEGVCAVMA